MEKFNCNENQKDPFGIRKKDFRVRKPEKSEMFTPEEARAYIKGCDFSETVDYLLLAWEIQQRFGLLENKTFMEAMCGPGRLGRDLLDLGAKSVIFHDGDPTMIHHAVSKARSKNHHNQNINSLTFPVDSIPLPDNSLDLIVCQNSTHQLSSVEKLGLTMKEFIRLIKPGGIVVIADYQRNNSPDFIDALEHRLFNTKQEIVPLLIPTFEAAFSKTEFSQTLDRIPEIEWLVTDACLPKLTPKMWKRVNQDPVKGHVLDRSPISLLVLAQKKNI